MLFTFLLLGAGFAASAQASSQLASDDAFLACREVESEHLRLECYDGIAAVSAPKTPAAAETEPDNLSGNSAEDTNAIIAEAADAGAVDEIVAHVTHVVKDGRGKLVLTLDNQQRWRQVSVEYFKIKVGDEVIIRKAALGSFALQQRSGGRKTKVRRQD